MYKEEFIQRVEKVLGKNSMAASHAKNGSNFLGRILDDMSVDTISANDVLNMSHEDLVIKAERIKECNNLYEEWMSGNCYVENELKEKMCPIMYLQNSDYDMKVKLEPAICIGVKYFSSFFDCQNWGCRDKCWKKYAELKK